MKFSAVLLLSLAAFAHCGRKVFNGKKIDIKDAPYQAALQHPNGSFFCGGTFISQKFVISAAHCTNHSTNPCDYKLSGGAHYLDAKKVTHFELIKVISHPDYKSSRAQHNDISLLALKKHPKFPATIKFPKLPLKDAKEGEMMLISGYGKTETSFDLKTLVAAKVPIFNQKRCGSLLGDISSDIVCAGGAVEDACTGDSGGPMVGIADNVLYGVTSFGEGCGRLGYPGGYARVTTFVDWLEKHMKSYDKFLSEKKGKC